MASTIVRAARFQNKQPGSGREKPCRQTRNQRSPLATQESHIQLLLQSCFLMLSRHMPVQGIAVSDCMHPHVGTPYIAISCLCVRAHASQLSPLGCASLNGWLGAQPQGSSVTFWHYTRDCLGLRHIASGRGGVACPPRCREGLLFQRSSRNLLLQSPLVLVPLLRMTRAKPGREAATHSEAILCFSSRSFYGVWFGQADHAGQAGLHRLCLDRAAPLD